MEAQAKIKTTRLKKSFEMCKKCITTKRTKFENNIMDATCTHMGRKVRKPYFGNFPGPVWSGLETSLNIEILHV